MEPERIPILPPGLPGSGMPLDDPRTGRLHMYAGGASSTAFSPMLLVHSVNAAAVAFEVRPLFDHYARSRPTYALDLPGFGLSDRSERPYTPRLMTDALHAVLAEIARRHRGALVDVLALSTSAEFAARAVTESPGGVRSLALVSPTGFSRARPRYGPPGSTVGKPWLYRLMSAKFWADFLYRNLTRPAVIRYFLARTWGSPAIDEGLWAYDTLTVKQPGAKNAPLYFLSAQLFSGDIGRVYDGLKLPVWFSHGVRGDFVRYPGAERMRPLENWHFTVFPTGALPHFEVLDAFVARYDAFLEVVTRDASATR